MQLEKLIKYIDKVKETLKNDYKSGQYLDILDEYNSPDFQALFEKGNLLNYCRYFDQINCLLWIVLTCVELEEYEKAFEVCQKIEKLINFHESEIEKYKNVDENSDEFHYRLFADTQKILAKDNITRFFANRAYLYYCAAKEAKYLKKFDEAKDFFQKALEDYKKVWTENPKDLESALGIAEIYYYTEKISENKSFFNEIKGLLPKLSTDFNILLSFCKLYYFEGKYDKALIYAEKALSLYSQSSCGKKVHAYDWLSRIAYKKGYFYVAAEFYDNLIECLLEENNFVPLKEGRSGRQIFPKPKLHKVFNYLNATKEEIRNSEITEQREQLAKSINATVSESNKNIKWMLVIFIITAVLTVFQICADHAYSILHPVKTLNWVAEQFSDKTIKVAKDLPQEHIIETASKTPSDKPKEPVPAVAKNLKTN